MVDAKLNWSLPKNCYSFFHPSTLLLAHTHTGKMQSLQLPSKNKNRLNPLLTFMTISCFLCITYLISSLFIFSNKNLPSFSTSSHDLSSSPTTIEHIVFGIASTKNSWSSTKNYIKLWWRPKKMKGCVFLESTPPDAKSNQLPPICISGETTRFRYTYRNGPRSAIRVARIVSETFALHHSNVRWFVFGDDDTIFFPENLVKTLSKYDHGLWYYIGTNSESYAQNKFFSYEMAFGGAGFAISYPLAKVLAKVLDSCLDRYPHLYGSDSRIHACIAELGVGLTHEPGFHQMDIRGNMFGFLASHPLSPLVSLHLSNTIDPIFPNKTAIQSLEHLFKAVSIDSQRIMQQTVCYDRWYSWTISVSWGYAVQIFPHHVFLPDALRMQDTYAPLKHGGGINDLYDVDTLTGHRHPDPCHRPPVFYFHEASSVKDRITTTYRILTSDNCTFDIINSPRKIEEIRVFSHKKDPDAKQLQAPRRHCCDVLPSSKGRVMEIAIRECGQEELIHMHP